MTPPGGWSTSRTDADYPSCLADTVRPPSVIHGFGDSGLLRPGLAVVGSRKATPYGIACAKRFAGWAAARGVVVISGAAYGCDRAAHEAAIDAGGATVAVLGCGADVDYPPSASGLLARLRASHAVISELGWGTRPVAFAFPNRNRIIAGLAAAVLVVEATPKSGTASTVEHALACGRDVLAVPGSILSETSLGCNALIRDGAHPICDEKDLADALAACGLCDEVPLERPGHLPSPADLDARDAAVWAAFAASPMHLDAAAVGLGIDVMSIAEAVSRLETRSLLARQRDGRYCVPSRERPCTSA